MRITADQTIADYPAVRVRQLMRETAHASVTLRHVRQVLRCSDSSAARVLNRREEDGLIGSVSGRLEPSTKGIALAMATAARPLRRTTATRLVADLIERARAVNSDDSWAYRVWMVAVFGSYVRGADRPSDVDIASGWSRYLGAMCEVLTARATLISHVRFVRVGNLQGSKRTNKSDGTADANRFATLASGPAGQNWRCSASGGLVHADYRFMSSMIGSLKTRITK